MTSCLAATGADPIAATLIAGVLVVTGLVVVALRHRSRRTRSRVFTALAVVAALLVSVSVGAPAHASALSGCVGGGRIPAVAVTTEPSPIASVSPSDEPTSTATPTIEPSPTIGPTAPAVGSAVQRLTFTVRDAPETGYVVTRRVWGGPRDVNNCVFERGEAPYDDEQVFGFGRPDGETTFRGTLEWQPISDGSCFFEASTLSWDIEFYDNLDLVDTWRIYAIDGNSATTSLGSGGTAILAALALSPVGIIASLIAEIGGAIIGNDLRATSPEVADPYSPIEATDAATLESDGQLGYRWTDRRPPAPLEYTVPVALPADSDDGRQVEIHADPGIDRCVNLVDPGTDSEAVPFESWLGGYYTDIRYDQTLDGRYCDSGRRALASWTITSSEPEEAGGAVVARWRIVNFSVADYENGSVCQVVVGDAACTNAGGTSVLPLYAFGGNIRGGWTLTVDPD
ncbi:MULTISPECIES: hypothetical protein [unclassified Rathayibacter]|uniref:hypothetical protein n=1 Tax=unclassified Rathayibacter TaxID=2609250 RepID=UPI0006F7F37E|nr:MULTISPECIES: hypothetical protein [unclassified Rathayibacter]KQQ05824.1 hypothetical protein ASF42_04550 [Rathayibacter sp. Leaf294]KQS13681.1 hypothetical protein ASG06_04560 [Rathayibacter sp. Leaf185]